MNQICLYVGTALCVVSFLYEIQIYMVYKNDDGRTRLRRLILIIISLAQLGVIVTFWGDSDWFWLYPMFIVAGVQAILVTLYVFIRSRAIFWDLFYRNMVVANVSIWWKLSVFFIVVAFILIFVLYSIPFVFQICVVLSWLCLIHFLNKLRIAEPASGAASRMFFFIIALVIATILLSVAFWSVFYEVFKGSTANLASVDSTTEALFVAGCVVSVSVWKFLLLSCLGYSTFDLLGCTKYQNDLRSNALPQHNVGFVMNQ